MLVLYKPDLKLGFHTQEQEGIQVLLPGCSSPQLEELIGTEMVPAIGADELLLKKLVLFKHFAQIPMVIRFVHLPLNLTLQGTRLPPVPTIFTNAKKKLPAWFKETANAKKSTPTLF